MASTTRYGEGQRRINNTLNSIPINEQTRRTVGIVSVVHPTKPRFVKAYSANDNSVLAQDNWIELNHSAQEIAERWGSIRIGFRIRVTFKGPTGAGADASVIGTETQGLTEPHIINEVARSLFAIFTPGI